MDSMDEKYSKINKKGRTDARGTNYYNQQGKRKYSKKVSGVGPTPDGVYFGSSSKPNWKDVMGRSDKH